MKLEESIDLAATPAVLWPWISTPERMSRWITDVERFEADPPGELREGSRLIGHPKRGARFEARVERVEPGQALALRASGLPNDLEILLTMVVQEKASGSTLIVRAEAELTGLMMFAEKMIATKARAKLKDWFAALQAAVV